MGKATIKLRTYRYSKQRQVMIVGCVMHASERQADGVERAVHWFKGRLKEKLCESDSPEPSEE